MEGSNYDCAVVMILISLFFFFFEDHEITRSRELFTWLVRLFIHGAMKCGARTRSSMVAGHVTRPGRREKRAQGGALGDMGI